jgi:hypothetical protein
MTNFAGTAVAFKRKIIVVFGRVRIGRRHLHAHPLLVDRCQTARQSSKMAVPAVPCVATGACKP